MELWGWLQVLLFLSAVLFVRSSKYHSIGYSRLFIDCGSSNETSATDDGLTVWHTDKEFIESGKNVLLTPNRNFNTMNTLRFFPDGRINCYKLPLSSAERKFLFRAGFFYGNYDGLSRPPSFNLEIDGNLWATVTTSMSEEEPVYHEVIYKTRKEQGTICLVRTGDDEVPFISSLEVTYMYDDMYKLMENKTALYLHSRINYGANKSVEKLIDSLEECCGRIWKSKTMSEYLNVTKNPIPWGSQFQENYAPWPVMATFIQANNVSDSIYLSVIFPAQTEAVAYFVLYFMDPIFRYPKNQTSKVKVYINNQQMGAIDVPNWDNYRDGQSVVSLYPVRVAGSANVTISSAEGATLAPLLNGMEVFHVIDVPNGGDLIGFSPTLSAILLYLIGTMLLTDIKNLETS